MESLSSLHSIESYESEQRTVLTLSNRGYGHGGYMGCGPELFRDRAWAKIFLTLMPSAYDAIMTVIHKTPSCWDSFIFPCLGKSGSVSGRVMSLIENNPIIAAYATIRMAAIYPQVDYLPKVHAKSPQPRLIPSHVAIEWDIHLDPDLVNQWKHATTTEEMTQVGLQLAQTLLIAHGRSVRLLRESWQPGQYWNIRSDRQTDLGGLVAADWMDIYGKALAAGHAYEQDRLADYERLLQTYQTQSRRTLVEIDQSGRDMYLHKGNTFEQALNVYREVCPGKVFSVFLDAKSLVDSPDLWLAVIKALNSLGVFVDSIGHFHHKELPLYKLGALQEVSGLASVNLTMPPVRMVKLFHGVGDIQLAISVNRITMEDTISFNGGSLLADKDWPGRPKGKYYVIGGVIHYLTHIKAKYRLHLHLYVQENVLDKNALDLLIKVANSNADLFDLGFSWGGISSVPSDITPAWLRPTHGLGTQGFISCRWNSHKAAEELGMLDSIGSKAGSESLIRPDYHN